MDTKTVWVCGFIIGVCFGIGIAPWGGSSITFPQSKNYPQIFQLATLSPSESPQAQALTTKTVDSMSGNESSGFFNDLDSRWMLRKLIHFHQRAVESSCENECPGHCGGRVWWQLHFEPSFTCPFARRVGPLGLNGKWICNPHRIDELARSDTSHKGCLVYSFRENTTSFSFETAVPNEVSKFCEVHVFSSKPSQTSPPENVHYHVYQIGSEAPAIPIQTLVHELGHENRSIDILNIDCGYSQNSMKTSDFSTNCEETMWDFDVYRSWLHESVLVKQLLIRMSWPKQRPARLAHVGQNQRNHDKDINFTTKTVHRADRVRALHDFVISQGFVVTHKEFDTTCGGDSVDMSFLHLGAEFQNLDKLKPTSPFYELKKLEIPKTTCWRSHRGLGPLSDPLLLQQKLGNVNDGADAMFKGWDAKGSGSGLSLRESLGYIDEPDADWMRRKLLHKEMLDKQLKKSQMEQMSSFSDGSFWYYNFDATFNCDFERRLGRFGDGGKWVCDPHRITHKATSKEGCLVYSIGSNGDSSFETSIHHSISSSCEMHTFDMNPWSHYNRNKMPEFINYHVQKIGIEPPSKSIPELVKDLNHSGRTIDIFKIDCEGCELDTFQSWFDTEINIRIILVEIHSKRPGPHGVRASHQQIRAFFQHLQSHGYVIYHKEPNTLGCGGTCQEYAFLKLHHEFHS